MPIRLASLLSCLRDRQRTRELTVGAGDVAGRTPGVGQWCVSSALVAFAPCSRRAR